ncbi:MAG TPA: hypothetical protein VKT78_18515 [Fimbriimonadaceae bacterium]|nr:hypothetical protein [Fimbriimonadaceae bacterium]
MGTTLLLASLLCVGHASEPVPMGPLWMELPIAALRPGFHPAIRFASWDITRFTRSTTYMVTTPDMVQLGQFQVQDGHYTFKAVMANELENADIAKLTADMNPDAARELRAKYARSMFSFEGTYEGSTNALTISYPVRGIMQSFELHAYTEGDNTLPVTVSDAARGFIGLWNAPDPYPGRLDAHWRTKIEEDGLQHFANEAKASDGAVFSALDLRSNGTFRYGFDQGTWDKDGGWIVLVTAKAKIRFQISGDGRKLLMGGKPAFVRA